MPAPPTVRRTERLLIGTMLLPAATGVLTTVVDGAYLTRDELGYIVWRSTGNVGRIAALLITLALGADALMGLAQVRVRALRTLSAAGVLPMVLTLLLVLLDLHRNVSIPLTITAMATLSVLAHAVLHPPPPATLRRLALLGLLIAVASLLFFIAMGARAANPCRADKCAPAGVLVRSFFAHENTMGIYFALCIPLLRYLRSRNSRLCGLAVLLGAVVLTGGRGAYAAAAIGSVCLYLLGLPGRVGHLGTLAIRIFPAAALLSSVYLFVHATPATGLTGRGAIFMLLRQFVAERPLFGPGRRILQYAFDTGQSFSYLLAHEHGAASYLLINGGACALSLFAIMLILWSRRQGGDVDKLRYALAAVAASTFLTEPVWEFQARSPYFFSLALAAATCGVMHVPPVRTTTPDLHEVRAVPVGHA